MKIRLIVRRALFLILTGTVTVSPCVAYTVSEYISVLDAAKAVVTFNKSNNGKNKHIIFFNSIAPFDNFSFFKYIFLLLHSIPL